MAILLNLVKSNATPASGLLDPQPNDMSAGDLPDPQLNATSAGDLPDPKPNDMSAGDLPAPQPPTIVRYINCMPVSRYTTYSLEAFYPARNNVMQDSFFYRSLSTKSLTYRYTCTHSQPLCASYRWVNFYDIM